MRKLSKLILVLLVVISDIMTATVTYDYAQMLCGIEHRGYSAPASVAFICAIPFIAIIVTGLAIVAFLERNTVRKE